MVDRLNALWGEVGPWNIGLALPQNILNPVDGIDPGLMMIRLGRYIITSGLGMSFVTSMLNSYHRRQSVDAGLMDFAVEQIPDYPTKQLIKAGIR